VVRDSSQRAGASSTRRADVAPAHFLERQVLRRGSRETGTREDDERGGNEEAIAHARYGSVLDAAIA